MKQIALYNYWSACWGQNNFDNLILGMIKSTEKCMQQEPSFDVEAELMPQKNPFAPLVQQENPFKSFSTITLITLSLSGETRGLPLAVDSLRPPRLTLLTSSRTTRCGERTWSLALAT